MDTRNREIIHKELYSNERILWEGRPNPLALLTSEDIFLIPFSFIWAGMAFTFGLSTFRQDFLSGFPFTFIPLLFMCVGFYISVGRFIYKYLLKKHTYYALTNLRVLVITNFLKHDVTGAYIKDIPTINKSVNSNGEGTLIFGSQNIQNSVSSNTGMNLLAFNQVNTPVAFYDIKNVEVVYRTLNDLKNK